MANLIEIWRQHNLGLKRVRQAAQAVASALKGDLKAAYHWENNQLVFECRGAQGYIEVTPETVCVSVKLSWLLAPTRGRIEQAIIAYLDRYLAEFSGTHSPNP